MPIGLKYVARLMVVDWTPSGSTTVTSIGAFGRNLTINEDMDTADLTTYGNTNRQYDATIKDASIDMEILLEDGYVIEDLLFSGANGTVDIYPHGKTAGKKKITMLAFVGSRPRSYAYDDAATMSTTFMPRGNMTESLVP